MKYLSTRNSSLQCSFFEILFQGLSKEGGLFLPLEWPHVDLDSLKNKSYEEAKHRQNAGFGIEWTVDTASLFQVPLKIEVAYPINDREYQKPQFIFLGVLTGN